MTEAPVHADRQPLRLLMVDDVEDDAALVVAELARAYDVSHRRVDTVEGLRDALSGNVWDLLITDVSLPGFTGMDVLHALAASGLDLPCIVISGIIEEEAAVEALRAGARDFISKNRLARLLPAVARELHETAERRETRQATDALEEQVRHAQRMDSVGSLAGGIAHDFNNLLTAILGFSSLLLDEPFLDQAPPQFRHDLDQIRKAGERAAVLTGQLLAFSHKQVLQPKVLNLNSVVGNLTPMLRRLIDATIDLTTCLAEDLGSTTADAGQLELVIMNLVVNARDAMPKGGTLTIDTANVDLDRSYANSHVDVVSGPHVMVAVSDTGIGITPDVRARIFEPFFTTKPPGRGTGLGLATIFGIVKQHHGHIAVESEPGRGSTFRVYFPRVHPGPDDDTMPVVAKGRGETVLLVEADAAVRFLAGVILTRDGYHVLECSHPDEAVDAVASQARPIDLLITDGVMPRAGGRTLAETLGERSPDLKVLYMSGYTVEEFGALRPGVRFLQKPFTPVTLTRAVRETLGGGSERPSSS